MSETASRRGILGAFYDWATSKYIGLPPETNPWTVKGVHILVQDGDQNFELAADLYQPILTEGQTPTGTVLVRCPYGRSFLFALFARPFAARGYQVLLVSSRGTFGSGGTFDPWRNEEHDGHAVVSWMREQHWYTGTFATIGASYKGFSQWALLRKPPHDLVAAVVLVAPHDFAEQAWGTGAFDLDWVIWGDIVQHQEEPGLLAPIRASRTPQRISPMLNTVQQEAAISNHFQGKAEWLERILAHPDPNDPYYAPYKFGDALENANIPILLAGGWYDCFLDQTMQQYARLSERNCHVALTVGAWKHRDLWVDGKTAPQTFEWLEEHLGKKKIDGRKATVQYEVTGVNEWREISKWPPATIPYYLYPRAGKSLSTEAPSENDGSSSFIFDPKNPTPAIGGKGLWLGCRADDSALASRPDVAIFTTDPLEKEVEIAGIPVVEISHSSNTPTADLFVRMSDVDTSGRSWNVTDAYKRLDSNREEGPVLLALSSCAHRFTQGHRIRLIIAGASHPEYALNVVTDVDGNPTSTQYTIRHGDRGASKLELPLVV